MENRAGRKGIEEKNEKNDTALGTEGEKDTKSKGLEKRLQENRKNEGRESRTESNIE